MYISYNIIYIYPISHFFLYVFLSSTLDKWNESKWKEKRRRLGDQQGETWEEKPSTKGIQPISWRQMKKLRDCKLIRPRHLAGGERHEKKSRERSRTHRDAAHIAKIYGRQMKTRGKEKWTKKTSETNEWNLERHSKTKWSNRSV